MREIAQRPIPLDRRMFGLIRGVCGPQVGLENGLVTTGEREIVPEEAAIVRRIFKDYLVRCVTETDRESS
jgi:hypothetical protein